MKKSKKRAYVRKASKNPKTYTFEELQKMIAGRSTTLSTSSAGTGDLKIPASTATVNNSVLDWIFTDVLANNVRLDTAVSKLVDHLTRILGPQGAEDNSKKSEKDGAATNWSGLAYEIKRNITIQGDKLAILEGLIERLAYA